MALKQNSKTKRVDAEKAGEHYCREKLGCIHTRRPVRTQFQSIDFFAADVVGKRQDGSHCYVQVTAGQAGRVRERRRKLEAYPWHVSDIVQLLQLVQTPDPADARRTKFFFRIHEYRLVQRSSMPQIDSVLEREWATKDVAIDIPKEWFKAWKSPETV